MFIHPQTSGWLTASRLSDFKVKYLAKGSSQVMYVFCMYSTTWTDKTYCNHIVNEYRLKFRPLHSYSGNRTTSIFTALNYCPTHQKTIFVTHKRQSLWFHYADMLWNMDNVSQKALKEGRVNVDSTDVRGLRVWFSITLKCVPSLKGANNLVFFSSCLLTRHISLIWLQNLHPLSFHTLH